MTKRLPSGWWIIPGAILGLALYAATATEIAHVRGSELIRLGAAKEC